MKKRYLIILFIFLSKSLIAQSDYSDFIQLKKLFIDEKYDEISQINLEFNKTSEFYPYVIFYRGVSEYKLNSLNKASLFLDEIIRSYPNWTQIDEVYYWMVKIDLDSNNLDAALKKLSLITNNQIRDYIYNILDPYLEDLSFTKLDKYYILYPKNNSIAKYYGRLLLKEYLSSDIINEINNILTYVDTEDLFVTDNSKFKIALLFPFMFEGLDKTFFIQNNDFIMDLYSGIKYGFENNDSINSNIEILSFDTRRDPEVVKKLITDGSLDDIDLIIGPLYSKPIEIVKQFCLENKIIMLNPLSSNNRIIDDNNYSFLFKPSLNTIALRAADYSIKNFINNKNVIIFYENTYQDSLIASLYKQKLDSSEYNIIYTKSVGIQDSRLILDSLASSYEFILNDSLYDTLSNVPGIVIKEGRGIENIDTVYRYVEKFRIGNDSIGHIFISSKNSLFASNVVSALDIREDTIPVIGYTEWLDFNVLSVDQFQNLDIRMIGSNYYYKESETFSFLENYFVQNYQRKISDNFLLGFDLINMIIKINNKYGKYFQFGLRNEEKIETKLESNPNYLEFNDNQNVIIYKVKDFIVKPLN